ncbi:MAG: hypothetical protein AAGC70_12630, partial [Pseudomonadota bacterium]
RRAAVAAWVPSHQDSQRSSREPASVRTAQMKDSRSRAIPALRPGPPRGRRNAPDRVRGLGCQTAGPR